MRLVVSERRCRTLIAAGVILGAMGAPWGAVFRSRNDDRTHQGRVRCPFLDPQQRRDRAVCGLRAFIHAAGALVVSAARCACSRWRRPSDEALEGGLCRLGPRVPTPSSTRAPTLPETVLVHTAEGPSGEWEVELSVQPVSLQHLRHNIILFDV